MTWADTNDKFQLALDNVAFTAGVLVPFFWEPEEWAEPVIATFKLVQEESEATIIDLWREAWELEGRPDPVPSLRATPGAYLEGINAVPSQGGRLLSPEQEDMR